MKTYTATLYATLRQDVCVQAENEEHAQQKMLELFDPSLAECEGMTDIEDFEEIAEMNHIYKLTAILGRAQELAAAVLTGDDDKAALLSEEVSGELAEFIEHLEGRGHKMEQECIDPELAELAKQLRS